jgi:glycosyltransferase involved in cell wall biosynthesis
MPPVISTIIPAFNSEAFIVDAINSVLTQRCKIENQILVIDDGSTDNTKSVVYNMSQRYPQISLISNERQKGPSGARNTGLLIAAGEYVAFLDADDLWYPNHLSEGVSFLASHNDIDVVFYNSEIHQLKTRCRISDWFSERRFTKTINVNEIDDGYYAISDDMVNALIDESFMHLQASIIRRSSIKNVLFNEHIKHSEDRDFFIRLYAESEARFAFKNLVTGVYFLHTNSLTSNAIQNPLSTVLDHIKLFEECLSHQPLNSITHSKLRGRLFESYMSASYYYRKLNSYSLALKCLIRSLEFGIAASQLKEFVKIVASFVIFHSFQRARRSS